jgi:hypothetical protein
MAGGNKVYFLLFALLGLVNTRHPFPGRILNRASEILQSYEYVIIGGGLSGLVVANRLSEHLGR